jgi:uncharacterized protein
MDRTVSSLSPKDLASYRRSLKKRLHSSKTDGVRFERAKKIAQRATSILKERFGVNRVVLFGSVVEPKRFHANSDIDLAVWDLSGREYFQAVGVLQSLDPDFKIDLISFHEALPALQEVILRDGKEL